jgi:hypothetical protein
MKTTIILAIALAAQATQLKATAPPNKVADEALRLVKPIAIGEPAPAIVLIDEQAARDFRINNEIAELRASLSQYKREISTKDREVHQELRNSINEVRT